MKHDSLINLTIKTLNNNLNAALYVHMCVLFDEEGFTFLYLIYYDCNAAMF